MMIPSVYLALWFGVPRARPWYLRWWGRVRVWQHAEARPVRWPG